MQRHDARALLGLPPRHSAADVETAFRRRATHRHPDRGGRPADFHLLVEARRALLSAPLPTNVIIIDGRSRLNRVLRSLRHRKRTQRRQLL